MLGVGKARERSESMADSAKLRAQSMDSPDETRTFEKGKMEIVNVEEVTAGARTLNIT